MIVVCSESLAGRLQTEAGYSVVSAELPACPMEVLMASTSA